MNCSLFDIINPIKIYVLLTLLFAYTILNRKSKPHKYLLYILHLCFVTEVINSIFYCYGLPTRIPYSISIAIHHTFWLLILRDYVENKKIVLILLKVFWLFALLNFIYIEIVNSFNYFSVVVGALIYLMVFIYESYRQMDKENIAFFISNSFIILFSPLLFFFGLSLMFGFSTTEVAATPIYKNGITLYELIINVACLIYYSLMNIYIYRERKLLKHG